MVDKNSRILQDKLVTYGCCPGYRDHHFELKMADGKKLRVDLDMRASLRLAHDILEMHDLAWCDGKPLDAADNEIKPDWIELHGKRPYYPRLFVSPETS